MDLYWETETTITPEKRIITTNHFFILKISDWKWSVIRIIMENANQVHVNFLVPHALVSTIPDSDKIAFIGTSCNSVGTISSN